MSYRNVFFGILGDEVVFNSREGDELDGSEIATYLPEIFCNHPLVKNERYGLKRSCFYTNDEPPLHLSAWSSGMIRL